MQREQLKGTPHNPANPTTKTSAGRIAGGPSKYSIRSIHNTYMNSFSKAAPNSAQIQVAPDGTYAIPTEVAIKLVREMFEGVGVDRLRADRYFVNLPFSDVSQLDDMDLTEAIAVGLNYLTDPMREQPAIKDALLKRLDTQFSRQHGLFIYRVGTSYTMVWPNHRTLAR